MIHVVLSEAMIDLQRALVKMFIDAIVYLFGVLKAAGVFFSHPDRMICAGMGTVLQL